MPKELKLVVCLPGNMFSGRFLDSIIVFLDYCHANDITCMISRQESSVVYFARAKCLGADVRRGKNQKPFDGKLDYDYILWIDSDIVFNYVDFQKLLVWNKDIVSGIYMMEDTKHIATVKDWDENYFKKYATFQFLTLADIASKTGVLINVSYTGMGFMLVKKGVFESLEYPWFEPVPQIIGDCRDTTSEDVSFCLNAKKKGFNIYIDPSVKVGHEKKVVL